MSFQAWLTQKTESTGLVGDLARLVQTDPAWLDVRTAARERAQALGPYVVSTSASDPEPAYYSYGGVS